jgi:hypothetical protein
MYQICIPNPENLWKVAWSFECPPTSRNVYVESLPATAFDKLRTAQNFPVPLTV